MKQDGFIKPKFFDGQYGTIQELFHMAMDRHIPNLHVSDGNGCVLNLGAGAKVIANSVSLDLPEWDAEKDKIPYGNNCFKTIHCYHLLEHVDNIIFLLKEIERVLEQHGVVNICVPYYRSELAHQDLDHKRFFTEQTWKNTFKNENYNKSGHDWKLHEHFTIIIGIVERNLCLLTQLIKMEK